MQSNKIGIDIASESFMTGRADSSKKRGYSALNHSYDEAGIANFIVGLDQDAHCIVEGTGVYHLRLCYELVQHGIKVSVVNPATIKYFAKMQGMIAKTDQLDAISICRWAEAHQGPWRYFQVPDEHSDQLRQRRGLLNDLKEELQRTRNRIHNVEKHPRVDAFTLSMLQQRCLDLQIHIDQVLESIEQIVHQHYQNQEQLLSSIPGFGVMSVQAIIESIQAFQGFENASCKAFVKYLGLAPCVESSGTSVRGHSSIGRSSVPFVRNTLYMAAVSLATRSKTSSVFKAFYLKLRANGKVFKEAIIALVHKMVKVAFAVLKSGIPYDQTRHSSKKENNVALCP